MSISIPVFSQISKTEVDSLEKKQKTDTIQKIGMDDVITQKDLSDVLRSSFNALRHSKGNIKVEKTHPLQWSVIPFAGYSLQTRLAVGVGANAAFFTDSVKDNQRVSTILTSVNYTQNNQIIVPFQSTIWLRKNTFQYITDFRYLSYPSISYGLGNHSLLSDGFYIDFKSLKIHQTLLRKVSNNFMAGGGYYYDSAWDIEELSMPSQTSFDDYTNNNIGAPEIASGFVAQLRYDSRRNPITPNNGWLFDTKYRVNLTSLGSSASTQTLQVDIRKYIPLSKTRENILAFWLFEWLTLNGKPNYLFLPSTGWDDSYNTGRGYIQGRYRGFNMHYFETEYRFQITNNGLIGGTVFSNAEYFVNDTHFEKPPYSNNFLHFGYGLGVRVKMNKHSNTNFCVDYGFGANGSKGFFVNIGEVF